MSEQGKEVTLNIKATIEPHGLYFTMAGASVTEGPYKDTAFNPSVNAYIPIVYVKKDGKDIATVIFDLQSIIQESIRATEAELAESSV